MSETSGPLALAQRGLRAYETLKSIGYDETPTTQQREALRGWSGWGPLAKAIDPFNRSNLTGGWKDLSEIFLDLLSPEEERAAKEATATSFYTTPGLAGAAWDVLTGLGFTGGRVLEPGCGGGNFIAATPHGLDVEWTGVEIDPTSAMIARKLNPQARIVNAPLERTSFRLGAFSAVIGNVPFARSGQVYDATWPEEAGFTPPLHWYFIWRAVKALHPGGLAVLITSRYTMDSTGAQARRFVSREAEFVGAIRLPSKAFTELGFDGLADIVVLRRRPYGYEGGEVGVWETATEHDSLKTSLNDYWLENPQHVLGRFAPRGGAMNGHTLDVLPIDGSDPQESLARAVRHLVAAAVVAETTWQPDERYALANEDVEIIEADGKEGSFQLEADGTVTQIIDGIPSPVDKPSDELKQLIMLRDTALELFAADADLERSDADLQPLREHAMALYRAYVDRYGALNRSTIVEGPEDEETGHRTYRRVTPSLGGFKGVDRKNDSRPGDPDYPTVLALGVWDDDTLTERPADILRRRVNKAPVRKQRADNPAEAVALCWDEHARLDMGTLARLLDTDPAQVPAALTGVAFEDPEAGEWVTSEEYLSGNVREKLRVAEQMMQRDADRWGANVAALQQVQPVDLNPSEIHARLGSPWIPARDVKKFIMYLFGLEREDSVEVRHEPFTAAWEVFAPLARKALSATTRWGSARINAVDLIEKALNGSAPVCYDTIEVPDPKTGKLKKKRVRNHEDTQIAEERTKALQAAFADWVWTDPKRSDRLCRDYNRIYNAVRLRQFDGSMFTFPGLTAGFNPYQHQRNMVARIVASPATICAHSVGAGKTSIMIMAALTMKRLGLVRKPCVTVPNHLLEQVTAEFRQRYPGARILMVTHSDLTPHRRKYFAARVASTDWDVIVMTHQQFTSIPVSPTIEAAFVADQIDALEEAIAIGGSGLDDSRTVKRMAAKVMKLKAHHAELTTWRRGKDNGLYFDHLGIDFIMCDEFHLFKNLDCPTRMEGFSMPASKRAEDMFMKISWLRDRNPDGRCFAGFTGTPISNTLAEAYTLMRYAMPRKWLADKRLASFDAFGGMYIVYESKIEVAPDGAGFRIHRRPARFENVPELRLMLGEFMDVRTRHQLKLAGPGRVDRRTVTIPAQPEMKPFIKELVARADAIRRGRPDEIWSKSKRRPVLDNMLSVCNDGRRAALWLPLVHLEGTGPGKPEIVAGEVARIYHETKDQLWPDLEKGWLFGDAKPGAFQMVFCDLGTPRDDDDQVYGAIRDHLIARGVPARMIRYAHQAKTDLERAFLFKQCREGDVAVLLVSTEKGGTGVNAQDRLVAIHHVDAPWRPADVEQRDGRGERPGNMCDVLHIVRYVTEGSFDSYMWQGLTRKSGFIFQILSGELDARQVDDLVGDDTIDYAKIMAMATGQESVMQLAQAQAEEARFKNLAVAYQRDRTRLKSQQAGWMNASRDHGEHAKVLEEIDRVASGAGRLYSTFQTVVADEEKAAELLAAVGRAARSQRAQREAGTWRGVRVRFTVSWYDGAAFLEAAINSRWGGRWVRVSGITLDMLKKGREGRLLQLIDREIDQARHRAAAERDQAAVLAARADAVSPELFKPFEYEEELAAAVRERERLEAQIGRRMTIGEEVREEVAA